MSFSLKKIRHKTIAIVAFAGLLPVVLLGLFFLTRTRDELTRKAFEMQLSLAEAVRQGVVSQIKLFSFQLERFAENIPIQSMKVENQTPAIFQFLDQNPIFYSCFIYNASGTVVSVGYRNRFHGDDHLIGKNIFTATRPELQITAEAVRKVAATGKMLVPEKPLKTHHDLQLLVMVPIRSFADSDKVTGILSAGIQIEGSNLEETIDNYFLGHTSFILLTDSSGTVLAKKGRLLPEGLRKMNLSREIAPTRFESTWTQLAGEDVIITIGRIPAMGCLIAIGTPSSEVFGFIQQIVWGILLLTAICLIVGIGFSLLLSETLIAPILGLIDGIGKVGRGVVSHRIDVQGEDELSDACRAFNDMAAQLEKNRLMDEIWSRKWQPPS